MDICVCAIHIFDADFRCKVKVSFFILFSILFTEFEELNIKDDRNKLSRITVTSFDQGNSSEE